MLCPTCPKKFTCQSACLDLQKELKRLENEPFNALKSPQQIEKIEEEQAEQRFYIEEYPRSQLPENLNEHSIQLDIARLYSSMRTLTEQQHRCISLYYWEGLSQNEIAERLRITRQTVSQHIEAAYSKIKKEYLRETNETTCPLTPVLVRGLDLRCA